MPLALQLAVEQALVGILLTEFFQLQLDVVNCIGGLNIQGSSLPGQGLDEDVHYE